MPSSYAGAGAGARRRQGRHRRRDPQQINIDISLPKMAARGVPLINFPLFSSRLNVVSSAGR